MKKYIYFSFIINMFLLSFFSCKKDAVTYEVDPAFEEYVQRFVAEGTARGKDINFDDTGLLVEFSNTIVNDASGYCFLGEHHIVIDKTEWSALTEDQKEYLMFHELGHCELDRRHKNDQFDNLVWKSMMRGDPLIGNQDRIPIPFFGFRKSYYLDELFNENAGVPDWSNSSFTYNDVNDDDKTLFLEKQDRPRLNESTSGIGDNFEMDINIKGINNVPFLTELSWSNGLQTYFIQIYKNFGTSIGVEISGQDQPLFYHPIKDNVDNITIRQNGGFTQVFFDEVFLFHFDALPGMAAIKLEAKDGNNVLVSTFSVENFELSELN